MSRLEKWLVEMFSLVGEHFLADFIGDRSMTLKGIVKTELAWLEISNEGVGANEAASVIVDS